MRPLFFIFLFACFFAGGQNNDNVFTLKPGLGINGCQVHGDTYAGYDKLGLFAGVAINARLRGKSSLELGFYFSQKGSRHNPRPTKGDFEFYKLNMNTIDMPLSFRYQVNKNYFITAGAYVAYLVNHRENINYVDWTNRYVYNKLEVGLNVGIGRKLGEKFSIELRLTNSVTPVRTFQNPTYYPNPIARYFTRGYYNNILTLFLSYKLDFKKKNANG